MEATGLYEHRLACSGRYAAGAGASTGRPDPEKVCGVCVERWPEEMSEVIPVRSVKTILAETGEGVTL